METRGKNDIQTLKLESVIFAHSYSFCFVSVITDVQSECISLQMDRKRHSKHEKEADFLIIYKHMEHYPRCF